MDRREFFKTTALAAAAFSFLGKLSLNAAETKQDLPDLVAVRNGEPAQMFQMAIEAYGGIGRFVKPGQKVVVKPNIAWDQPPEIGANTNPELVAEIVRQCFAAGAASVDIFDHTCNEWRSCYKHSGIAAAAQEAGAKVHSGANRKDYREAKAPNAKRLKQAQIHSLILDADVFINVPILKHHGGAKMTSAMKNLMGIVWDRGYMHKNDLSQCIADSVLYRKPDLNIVDAYRVMKAHGPRGASLADVSVEKYLMLSTDIVALDTVAAHVLGCPLDKIGYLPLGEAHGLGTMDLKKLKIKRIEA